MTGQPRLTAADHIPLQAELDALRLASARRIRKRREIGRTIGDMHAVEQAVAKQTRGRRPQHRFGGRRYETHCAVTMVTGNHVAHITRQQAIAVFLDIKQGGAGACEQFGAKCQTRGIERCRRHTEGGQDRLRVRADVVHWQ